MGSRITSTCDCSGSLVKLWRTCSQATVTKSKRFWTQWGGFFGSEDLDWVRCVKLGFFALRLNLCNLPLHDVFQHLITKGEVVDDKSCKKCSRLGSWVDYFKASLHHKEGGDLPFDLGLSASVLATPNEIAYQAFEMCTHSHGWALACKWVLGRC